MSEIIVKRLFIAIKISNFLLVENLISTLKSKLMDEKINWVRADNLHLTLRFLGKTNSSDIPKIKIALQKTIENIGAFIIESGKIGIFGSKHAPKVIWLEIKSNGILEEIEKKLSHELEKAGFERDNQNFVAHLTLGRIPGKLKSQKYFQSVIDIHQNTLSFREKTESVFLFSSRLTPEGPKYYSEMILNFLHK